MSLKYELIDFQGKTLRGREIKISKEYKKQDQIKNFWIEVMKNIDLTLCNESYGISRNYDFETQGFDYTIAIDEKILKDPKGYYEYQIPKGKYAKFKYVGIMEKEEIEKFYAQGFKAIHGVMDMERGLNSFEYYGNEYIGIDNPKSIFYLFIPIK